MPYMTGLESRESIAQILSELRILIFTEFGDMRCEKNACAAAADGFVEKGEMPEGLMEEVCRLFPRVCGEMEKLLVQNLT